MGRVPVIERHARPLAWALFALMAMAPWEGPAT
jgi:hypothetical protein